MAVSAVMFSLFVQPCFTGDKYEHGFPVEVFTEAIGKAFNIHHNSSQLTVSGDMTHSKPSDLGRMRKFVCSYSAGVSFVTRTHKLALALVSELNHSADACNHTKCAEQLVLRSLNHTGVRFPSRVVGIPYEKARVEFKNPTINDEDTLFPEEDKEARMMGVSSNALPTPRTTSPTSPTPRPVPTNMPTPMPVRLPPTPAHTMPRHFLDPSRAPSAEPTTAPTAYPTPSAAQQLVEDEEKAAAAAKAALEEVAQEKRDQQVIAEVLALRKKRLAAKAAKAAEEAGVTLQIAKERAQQLVYSKMTASEKYGVASNYIKQQEAFDPTPYPTMSPTKPPTFSPAQIVENKQLAAAAFAKAKAQAAAEKAAAARAAKALATEAAVYQKLAQARVEAKIKAKAKMVKDAADLARSRTATLAAGENRRETVRRAAQILAAKKVAFAAKQKREAKLDREAKQRHVMDLASKWKEAHDGGGCRSRGGGGGRFCVADLV
jgi:hypothetical protein